MYARMYLDVCPSVCVSHLDILVEVFSFLLACPLLCHLELSSLQGKVPSFFMTLGEDTLLFLKEVLLKGEESGEGEGGNGGGRKGEGKGEKEGGGEEERMRKGERKRGEEKRGGAINQMLGSCSW